MRRTKDHNTYSPQHDMPFVVQKQELLEVNRLGIHVRSAESRQFVAFRIKDGFAGPPSSDKA